MIDFRLGIETDLGVHRPVLARVGQEERQKSTGNGTSGVENGCMAMFGLSKEKM